MKVITLFALFISKISGFQYTPEGPNFHHFEKPPLDLLEKLWRISLYICRFVSSHFFLLRNKTPQQLFFFRGILNDLNPVPNADSIPLSIVQSSVLMKITGSRSVQIPWKPNVFRLSWPGSFYLWSIYWWRWSRRSGKPKHKLSN